MKFIVTLLSLAFFGTCASPNEKIFTASTPAAPLVRKFLGIPLIDSVDFIRWTLSFNNNKYNLECNYGIGKPNTNGFYNGGKKVSFTGEIKKEKNIYTFQNGEVSLKVVEVNNNLLHILNEDNTLMIGNGGWSYMLNIMNPVTSDQLTLKPKQVVVKDSIAYQGRTPCGIPLIPKSKDCYKIKWLVVLYANTTYRIMGSPFYKEGGRKGKWNIITVDGKIIYRLLDKDEQPFIRLLMLDEGVVEFVDEKNNLLVGDHDFSYTLNRKF